MYYTREEKLEKLNCKHYSYWAQWQDKENFEVSAPFVYFSCYPIFDP